MAVYQIESGTAHGRGFSSQDANGFLAKLYAWITKNAASGGPGWSILLDKSATPSGENISSVDTGLEQVTITGHSFYTGERVVLTTTGALPGGLYTSNTYYVIKVDANTISFASSLENAYDGTEVNISSAGSGTHTVTLEGAYIICSNNGSAGVNTSQMIFKIGMITTEAGYVRIQYFLGWDSTNNVPMSLWSGYRLNTYDDADFAYDFRGGEETMIVQSRLGTAWYSTVIDKWIGDANRVEATDKTGTLQSGVTAGSSVVLQLGTGEASNFTEDNYYYIHDLDGHNWINYVQVTNVNAGSDQITVDTIDHDFPSGAVIAAYTHRWYTMGNGTTSPAQVDMNAASSELKIPYVSSQTESYAHFKSQVTGIFGYCILGKMKNDLGTASPNDVGKYAVQKPVINESHNFLNSSSTVDMNRGYGTTNNVYITYDTSLAAAQDGRTIGASNYLFFLNEDDIATGEATLAMLFLDTESLS